MRKFFFAFLLSGVFLLMLSSLVVSDGCTDQAADAAPVPPEHTILLSMPASMPEAPAKAGCDDSAEKASFVAIADTADVDVPKALISDANGRVLTALRYENSFYQLFHPEVAGG